VKIVDLKPHVIGFGSRNLLIVTVETDDGTIGLGEAGLTGREQAVIGCLDHFRPLLLGQDPFRTEHLWQRLSRAGFFPAQRIAGAALSAIDLALWDIKGKALGVPVYQLLGGRCRDHVDAYVHVGKHLSDPAEMVALAREAVAAGWRFLRLAIPDDGGPAFEPRRGVRRTLEILEKVRVAVGPEIELCLDAHTKLDLPDALHLCRQAEVFDLFFMEDPLRCEYPEAYRTLRRQTRIPLAAGEQFSSKWEFRALIEEDLIDYARIDLAIAGGFTEARKIAGWCETHQIRIVPHNPLGPVSAAAGLHFDLATTNFAVQELVRAPGTFLTDVFPVQAPFRDGRLLPPDAPGLGVTFDPDAAARHPMVEGNLPELRREDGAFTNW
jgi:galactonate dehydratase